MIMNESKEAIRNLIDSVGVFSAQNILGLSLSELITISGSKIYPEIMHVLLPELLIDGVLPSKYKEFSLVYDGDGILTWSTLDTLITRVDGGYLKEIILVYATPYWDDSSLLPIDVEYYEGWLGKGNTVGEDQPTLGEFDSIQLPDSFNNMEELLTFFNEVYSPTVYNLIMNKILPLLRDRYFN